MSFVKTLLFILMLSTAADAQTVAKPYQFNITASGATYPIISGSTTAPDGTRFFILIKKPWLPDGAQRVARGMAACGTDCFPATGPDGKQGAFAIVRGSRFSAGPFSFSGKPLEPNVYPLEISISPNPETATVEELRQIGTPIFVSTIQITATKSKPAVDLSKAKQKLGDALNERNRKNDRPTEEWKRIKADNGLEFAIETNSISHFNTGAASAAICMLENNVCFPLKIRRLFFDCNGHYRDDTEGVRGPIEYIPPKSIAKQVEAISCAGSKDTRMEDASK